MAFLLSSAVTDPQMFAITVATLGLPFALGKTVAAFGIGLFSGGITWAVVRAGRFREPVRQSSVLQALMPQSSRCVSDEVSWRFWREPERVAVFRDTCWRMARLVVFLLGAAFVAEYFVKLYLPEDALAGLVGRDNPLSVPVAALLAAPLYLDGYAALPLVRGLIDRGMAEGAAMAFLISGGIICVWTAVPVFALSDCRYSSPTSPWRWPGRRWRDGGTRWQSRDRAIRLSEAGMRGRCRCRSDRASGRRPRHIDRHPRGWWCRSAPAAR